jgi:hypothetical protein
MSRARRSIRRSLVGRGAAVAAAAALLLLGGCKESIADEGNAGTAARDRWAHEKPANYSYTILRDCFCQDAVVQPVRVEVHGGDVTSRTYVATGAAVDAQWASYFPTIDGLFAELDTAEPTAQSMTVTYDRQYGYPTHARIDPSTRVQHDETEYWTSDFAPLP